MVIIGMVIVGNIKIGGKRIIIIVMGIIGNMINIIKN